MKIEECDVIQDLLPSYSDKLLSDTSNKLVEEHLKKCKNCSEVLKNMNKEIDTSTLFNQDEQIDYLKGYRRKKILTVICAVIITVFVLVEGFIIVAGAIVNMEFLVDVDEIYIEGWQVDNQVGIYTSDENYIMMYDVIEDEENNEIVVKISGKFSWEKPPIRTATLGLGIDENVEKIYIEDKDGKRKEVWNKEDGILVNDVTTRHIESEKQAKEAEEEILKKIQEINQNK
jgi:hypothetical protein